MDFGPHLLLALIEGGVGAAVLALTAVGLGLVFGVMRVVNVAHGEFFMLGAVFAWFIATTLGGHPAIGFLAALLIAPVIVGAIAAVADMTVLKRIDYDPERTIVATIGLLYIIQQATLMTYGPEARAVEPPFNQRIAIPWYDSAAGEWFYPWAPRRPMHRPRVRRCDRRVVLSLGPRGHLLQALRDRRRHRRPARRLGADEPHQDRPPDARHPA